MRNDPKMDEYYQQGLCETDEAYAERIRRIKEQEDAIKKISGTPTLYVSVRLKAYRAGYEQGRFDVQADRCITTRVDMPEVPGIGDSHE